MKNIEVDYHIVRNGEVILEDCYATVGLTDKNVKEVAAFILDGHGSGELVDIPGHVYDRIVNAVTETAIRDLKEIANETLYDSDEVVLQEVLPMDLVDLMPQEVVDIIDVEKIEEYYAQYDDEEDAEDTGEEEMIEHVDMTIIEPGLDYNDETDIFELRGDEDPNKENTLYLTISQKNFDAIISGTKTSEERELKETTVKKYLDLDENGNPYFNSGLMAPEDPLNGDIYVWNNGKYPYYPNPNLRYLNLAVGYNKERDTALVELGGFMFKPMPTKTGIIPRFNDDGEKMIADPNGAFCFWCIDMLIKRVVECHRVKK